MITLVGAGNVATWIAQRLQYSEKFRISTVYSRNICNAKKVAKYSNAKAINDIKKFEKDSDIYILALSDDAYSDFISALPFQLNSAFLTSGSISCRCLNEKANNYGVIYPLQTFTKSQDMYNLEVPLCVESQYAGIMSTQLWELCNELSPIFQEVSEEQRAILHLAAVFACNFSNAMFSIANTILSKNNLQFNILHPLLKNTLEKLESLTPTEAQTGPAIRNDQIVMAKHLSMLKDDKLKELYSKISEYIYICRNQ